ncbi:MAG: DNA translocase FtsK [Bacillota bacterium]
MSWLKKVFGRLKDDPIHSEESSFQEERNINAQKDKKNKDFEAKISYQYPKGEFRFPIIPDQRGSDKEGRENRSQQRRQRDNSSKVEENQPQQRRQRRTPSKGKENQSQEEANAAKGRLKKEKPTGDASKRPFRPTEIPSPIYGFSKPAKKDPIQFELKSQEPRLWGKTDKKEDQPQPKNQHSEEASLEDFKSDLFENEGSEIHEKKEVQTGELEPMNFSEEPKSEQVHTDSFPEILTEESEVTEKFQGNSSAEVEHEVESVIEMDEVQVLENDHEETEKPLNSVIVKQDDEEPLNEIVESPVEAVPVLVEESLQNEHIEEEHQEGTAESVVEQEVSAPAPASKRSHLPFNVLMLKQDKRMMERKKRLKDMRAKLTGEEALPEEHDEVESSVNSAENIQTAVKEEGNQTEESSTQVSTQEEHSEQTSSINESPSFRAGEELQEKTEEQSHSGEETVAEEESLQTHQGEGTYEKGNAEQAVPVSEAVSASTEGEVAEQSAVAVENVPLEANHEQAPSQSEQETTAEPSPLIEGSNSEPTKAENSSKRSHLPFNVLMLKQDKRKMSKQPAPSPSKPIEAVEEKEDDASLKKFEELASQPLEEEGYEFPQLNFLSPPIVKESSGEWLEAQRELLNDTLANFNVRARVVNVTEGPAVTRFEVQPEPGVKVNKITNLADDIKLSLAARDIRIEAPIPGKHTIGIEVPNRESRPVSLSEIISSSPFQDSSSPLTAALGLDISGEPIVTDLNKMPHGLIAGATGSGKSVCINSILVSLLYKASPQDLKLLLIDPKMVELAPYNRMPHLVSPVITDVKAATAALKWAVEEMERRYELFAHTGVRDITRYNLKAERNGEKSQKLPYLVIVIDELADLMMMSPADVEEAICRIAQKARACGIHLIIATQRPSVDVITGLIKANVPTRIAFSVSSGVDSRTIIDGSGAEKLLGKGDMLFLENGSSKPVRLQGTFVSDDEIDEIVNHVREQGEPNYLFQQDELLKKAQVDEQEDELFLEACEFVVNQGGASTSLIQRHFRVGYNRAARLVDMMESHGIVSEAKGSKPRDVLISSRELDELQETSTKI